MRSQDINAMAERLQRMVNDRAAHDARELGVGSVAENSVYRQHAEKLLGDWDWIMSEGLGVSPRVLILRYRGHVEFE